MALNPNARYVQVTLNKELRSFLEKHDLGSASTTIKFMLKVFQKAMEKELQRLNLSVNELKCVLDALNGFIGDPDTIEYLWAEIQEAIELDGLDKKWGIDGEKLVKKLRNASPTALFALYDMAQRFYKKPGTWTDEEIEELKEF
jgi:hypothetical protein